MDPLGNFHCKKPLASVRWSGACGERDQGVGTFTKGFRVVSVRSYPTALLRTNPEARVIRPKGSDSRASGSGFRA